MGLFSPKPHEPEVNASHLGHLAALTLRWGGFSPETVEIGADAKAIGDLPIVLLLMVEDDPQDGAHTHRAWLGAIHSHDALDAPDLPAGSGGHCGGHQALG